MTDLEARCPDCQVGIGQPHLGACDVARCLWSGLQRLQCFGEFGEMVQVLAAAGRQDLADQLQHYLSLDDLDHRCGDEVWSGVWPGVADCRRLGLWVIDGCSQGLGWIRAHRGDIGATESLNDLHSSFIRWDREAGRYVWASDARPSWWLPTDPEPPALGAGHG